jgi:hypothetical protein
MYTRQTQVDEFGERNIVFARIKKARTPPIAQPSFRPIALHGLLRMHSIALLAFLDVPHCGTRLAPLVRPRTAREFQNRR